jgi:hypothetical protein
MSNEGLWEQLEKLDCAGTAQRANCEFLSDENCYTIQFLNAQYTVDLSAKKIYLTGKDSSEKPATFLEELCLLAYLINAKDLPFTNKLVKAETLPAGQFFFRGMHALPTKKLEEAFGTNPELLLKTSERFNAKKREFGDTSITLYVLPRLPLTIVIWRRCEEFEARASILFDQNAASLLPLDALLVAVNLTVNALIEIAANSGQY